MNFAKFRYAIVLDEQGVMNNMNNMDNANLILIL